EPEIARVDLAGAILDIAAWGGDPLVLDWFERPRAEMIAAAVALLERLGAIRGGALTAIGRQIHRVPVHPRLARALVEARGARQGARACALLSGGHCIPPRGASTTSDLLSAIDEWTVVPAHVQRVAREIEELALRAAAGEQKEPGAARSREGLRNPPALSDAAFRRALLAGYPDRV